MEHTLAEPRAAADRAPISLRKATLADAPALRELHRAALTGIARRHYSARQIDSLLRHVPTLDEALIEDRTYFVAEADGSIVGCGGWSARAPGYQPVLGQARRSVGEARAANAASLATAPVLIRAMYTHPAWSRRGIGRRILAAAEREALRETRPIELDALLPGLPLYLSAAYVPLRTHALELPDGQVMPVVYMRKLLP